MAQGKVYDSFQAALADLEDGATVLVSGFGGYGMAAGLLDCLAEMGKGDLTLVYSAGPPLPDGQGGGSNSDPVARLVANGQVRKLITSLPFAVGDGGSVQERWQSGKLEIEVVPQGVLVERLRAGGAGIGGVFLPTPVGTRFEASKEKRSFAQGDAVLELPLKADYALIRVVAADTLGNANYGGSARNWGPAMAMAARITVAEADQIVEPGDLDPEGIISPGIFVNRIVAAA